MKERSVDVKLLHVADLHLDSPFVGIGKQLQTVAKALIQAPFQAFERCVSIAINQQVDVMVIAGDIYDADKQTIQAQYFFVQQLKRLEVAGIQVVLCHGNHDYLKLDRPGMAYPANVHSWSGQEVKAIDLILEKTQEHVRFYGFSYSKRWINERMIDRYPANSFESTYTIGVLHGQMEGEHYAPFDVASLLSKNYDYWALGHIHQARVLNEQPLIQYSGCIQGRHRQELGDKGAFIIEFAPNTPAKSHFISLAPIVWQEATVRCQAQWHELELVQAAMQVIANYQAEASVSQQSQLVTLYLEHFELLDSKIQAQVESGELFATLSQSLMSSAPFVTVVKILPLRQSVAEPFQYDSGLQTSFDTARQALREGELYAEVMEPLFKHPVLKTWLNQLPQEASLQQALADEATQLVIQAVGFETEEVSHEN